MPATFCCNMRAHAGVARDCQGGTLHIHPFTPLGTSKAPQTPARHQAQATPSVTTEVHSQDSQKQSLLQPTDCVHQQCQQESNHQVHQGDKQQQQEEQGVIGSHRSGSDSTATAHSDYYHEHHLGIDPCLEQPGAQHSMVQPKTQVGGRPRDCVDTTHV